jgi:hypothetical protein
LSQPGFIRAMVRKTGEALLIDWAHDLSSLPMRMYSQRAGRASTSTFPARAARVSPAKVSTLLSLCSRSIQRQSKSIWLRISVWTGSIDLTRVPTAMPPDCHTCLT